AGRVVVQVGERPRRLSYGSGPARRDDRGGAEKEAMMELLFGHWLLLAGTALLLLAVLTRDAASEELGGGFRHHGVATPISNHRGTVATVDGEGHAVVLSWLRDHRGCYELLLVDVDAGKAEEYP